MSGMCLSRGAGGGVSPTEGREGAVPPGGRREGTQEGEGDYDRLGHSI